MNILKKVWNVLAIILVVYLFLLSIKFLGHSFKLFGKDFAEATIQMTSHPLMGLLIGIFATSLIQSSSTTTSIVVGLVAGGALTLGNAIPIIMGANIGTTITNSLVSLGHISNRVEFRRAFSAGIVHDFFNIMAVLLFFPIEVKYHIIQKSAVFLEREFAGMGGVKLFNPLKAVTDPIIHTLDRVFGAIPFYEVFLLIVSLALIFLSLAALIRMIRKLVVNKLETAINDYLFKNDFLGLTLGLLLTLIVQSSSVTTSLIIPLAGAGVLSLKKIFPYTLGANVGTTGTAILASLATQNEVAITVAFSHLCFNLFGIAVFYPLKFLPIGLAEWVGKMATKSKKNMVVFVGSYLGMYSIPIIYLIIIEEFMR